MLTGLDPAGGSNACCARLLCKNRNKGSVYQHHFFECVDHSRNRSFFQDCVKRLYNDSVSVGHCDFPHSVVDEILKKPCGMWVGLFEQGLFGLGLKLWNLHELHRIVTMASVFSWGRFYALP